MKRRLLKLGLFLLAGAIANVAVAFYLPFVASEVQVTRPYLVNDDSDDPSAETLIHVWNKSQMGVFSFRTTKPGIVSRWHVPTHVAVAFGVSAPPHQMRSLGLLRNWEAIANATTIGQRDVQVPSIESVQVGWPFLTVEGDVITQFPTSNDFKKPLETIGLNACVIQTPSKRHIAVPYKPIWPDFAINTIFYAALLWVVFAFPFVIRRRRRIKRGLCPACAYPVGSSPVCTECGAAIAHGEASPAAQ